MNPYADDHCDFIANGGLLVDDEGKINECLDLDQEKIGESLHDLEIIELTNKLVMPCFADIHFHWVQEDVCMMPKANLMTWLEAYTWPSEAKFENKVFSKIKAETFFQELARLGTSMGMIYSSTHEHACRDAFSNAQGEFFIGATMMTKGDPEYLVQDEANALESCRRLASNYGGRYVVTPRFTPSCTESSMAAAAKIAAEHGSWIQTHVAETTDPEESSLKILDDCGILTDRTVLGHCIHLDQAGYDLIAQRGSKIAHCPSSNAPVEEMGLGSGLFDFRAAEESGVDWALASDIGAGPYLSMFDVMKSFYDQNQIAFTKSQGSQALNFSSDATAIKALYRATLKGAEILGLGDRKGNFAKGKDAEFIVLDFLDIDGSLVGGLEEHDAESILEMIFKKPRASYASLVDSVYNLVSD